MQLQKLNIQLLFDIIQLVYYSIQHYAITKVQFSIHILYNSICIYSFHHYAITKIKYTMVILYISQLIWAYIQFDILQLLILNIEFLLYIDNTIMQYSIPKIV